MVPPFLRKDAPCESDTQSNDNKTCATLNTSLLIGGSIGVGVVLTTFLYVVAVRIEHYKELGVVPGSHAYQQPFSYHHG